MMKLTLQDRLAIYRKAKRDYVNVARHTDLGFCYYFFEVHKLNVCIHHMKTVLPELYRVRPKPTNLVWFPKEGPIPERIACLDAAIKMCEQQLNEQPV